MSICLVRNSQVTLGLGKKTRMCLLLSVSLLLSSCLNSPNITLPAPLPEPARKQTASSDQPLQNEGVTKFSRTQRLAALSIDGWENEKDPRWQEMHLPDGVFDLNVETMPLKEFIHVALGDVLGLSFDVDAELAKREDPITLRISTPVTAPRLLAMVEQVMATYKTGLAWDDSGLHVLPASKLLKMPPSPVGSIHSLSGSQGRVMTIIPLHYSAPAEVLSFVRHFIQMGKSGDVQTLTRLNALLVTGKLSSIERFKSAVAMVDRPALAGQHLQLIRTIYWQPSDIVPLLKDALKLQGIAVAEAAGSPGVYVNSVEQLNAVMVAAPNKQTTSWIGAWVEQLDTPEVAGESLKTFVYRVKHSTAGELGGIISAVIGGALEGGGEDNTGLGEQSKTGGSTAAQKQSVSSEKGGGAKLRIVIDEPHNSLVFVGSARAYRSAYQLLQQLDVPAKQVLLEVTIADVTLDASTQLGIEWGYRSYDSSGNLDKLASTAGGLGLGSGGLTLALQDAAEVQTEIHALAANGDAKILSSPKLLAVDNEEARIQVGTEIAVITSEIADSNSTADSGVLRSFEYIDTGVILQFTPTVMANGVVRLDVYQEVSAPGASNNNTPPIAKRTVETTLVAESGQTIMLGGLITHNTTEQVNKVPFLGDIPWLGNAFKNTQTTDNSTEMIIMITPHVIESTLQAVELTESYRAQLDW